MLNAVNRAQKKAHPVANPGIPVKGHFNPKVTVSGSTTDEATFLKMNRIPEHLGKLRCSASPQTTQDKVPQNHPVPRNIQPEIIGYIF